MNDLGSAELHTSLPQKVEAQSPEWPYPIYPLNPSDVRFGDRVTIVRNVVHMLDQGDKPDLNLVESLLSRVITDERTTYVLSDDNKSREVIWPDSEIQTMSSNFPLDSTQWYGADKEIQQKHLRENHEDDTIDHPVPKNLSKMYPDGIHDFDDYDALRLVTLELARRLPESEQIQCAKWAIRLIDFLADPDDFIPQVLGFVSDMKQSGEVFKDILEYVLDEVQDYKGSEIAWRLAVFDKYREDSIVALTLEGDDTRTRDILGVLINENNYADTINTVQKILRHPPENLDTYRVERIGRMLLGLDPDDKNKPFFTAAYELYQKFNLDKYGYLEKELPQDLTIIREVLGQISEGGSIVELGSGTGRVTNALALERPEKIIGVEVLPEYIKAAQQRDTTHKVEYRQGDWRNTDLPDGSAKLVMSLARSLMAADEKELQQVILEARRLCGKNGKMLFSYGNPNSEKYKKDKLTYLDILKKLHTERYENASLEKVVDELDVIVSSSDGIHWVNRYAYSEEKLKRLFQNCGMDLSVIKEAPILGLEGASSYYYMAVPQGEPLGKTINFN